MEQIVFSVRCTREEYMNFAVKRHEKTLFFTVCGVILLIGAAGAWMLQGAPSQMVWLVIFLGLLFLTLEPLWLPLWRKGAAARQYDASDSLQQAVAVTVTSDAVIVRTACEEGTLPLTAMTQVIATKDMTALVFGKEFTLYIPSRALREDEWTFVKKRVSAAQVEKS